jgi:hypothetical protein
MQMNKNRLVALGLILFVLLFTFPFVMNFGKTTAQTQPPPLLQDARAMQELADKLGVKNAEEFREKHRQILSEWKELAVRDGKRIYVAKDGREVPISLENLASQPQYCSTCHDYAGIEKPSCWTCHEEPKGGTGK